MKQYNYEGQIYSLQELIKIAKGKEIILEEKKTRELCYKTTVKYAITMPSNTIFIITEMAFKKSLKDLPDLSSDYIKKEYNKIILEKEKEKIPFGRMIDFRNSLRNKENYSYNQEFIKFFNLKNIYLYEI